MAGSDILKASRVSQPEPSPEAQCVAAGGPDEPMLYCPVCSIRLTERKCKLFCERCGYYLSCADYY
jgi:hypothetical protein